MIDFAAECQACLKLMRMGDWRIEFKFCSAEEMPINGALAVACPTPTRSMATIYVLNPWPTNESISETLCHELAHVKLSPMTALLENNAASVMIEERIVEDFGIIVANGFCS